MKSVSNRRARRLRSYPPDFKAKVLAAVDARGDRQVKEIAADFDIHTSQIQRWRRDVSGQVAPAHPPIPPPGKSYPPDFKAHALAWLAAAGRKPLKEVARELKIDPSTLRDWRRQAAPEPAKRTRGSYQGKVSEEQRLAAVAEYNAGRPTKEIAAELGVSGSAVLLWVKRINGTSKAPAKLVALPANTWTKSNGNGGERLPAPVEIAHAARDARVFLRQAKRELLNGIRRGELDDLDSAHLLSLLALRSLEGGGNA